MRVLGIDPGLRSTGWGLVDVQGSKLRHVANGQCQTPAGPLAGRLLALFDGLSEVIERYEPSHAAVEQTFVNRDGAGTLKLGQARGIAMLVPAKYRLEVGEYAPNAVKKAVVGVGHADKRQVEHMVSLQLPGAQAGWARCNRCACDCHLSRASYPSGPVIFRPHCKGQVDDWKTVRARGL